MGRAVWNAGPRDKDRRLLTGSGDSHAWSAMSRPRARLLSIGDELVNGRTVDTNATHLARCLTDAGFLVVGIAAVGDGHGALATALTAAADDADLVVCTGGLGPTDDDRTRAALAQVVGVSLVEDAGAWKAIRRRWALLRPGQEPSPSNRRQALVPTGAAVLANDRGTAPGLLVRRAQTWIACLPGVPHEMIAMAERLIRTLPRRFPGLVVPRVAELYLAGVGESLVQEHLYGQFDGEDPQVGITVSESGHLVLRVVGTSAAVRARLAILRRKVRPWLLPAPGLAASIIPTLAARSLTITTAESCTVGLVAAALGSVPGASAVLHEALVAYAPEAKRRRLGVAQAAVQEVVSQACVEAMARGARRRTGADVAVATTGLAGPGGGSPDLPVGTVWVAVADVHGVQSRSVRIDGSRARVQSRAVTEALLITWERLAASRTARGGIIAGKAVNDVPR